MGFELKNDAKETFEFTGTGWTFFLNLAAQYGWQSQGTQKPKGFGLFKKWHGQYDTNENQLVQSQDAQSLAAALEKAVADPELPQIANKLGENIQAEIEKTVGYSLGYSICGEIDKDYLKQFILYCRKGPFRIT